MSSGDELDMDTGRLAGRGRKGRGLRPRQRHVLRIKDGRQEVSQRQMEGWGAGGGECMSTLRPGAKHETPGVTWEIRI